MVDEIIEDLSQEQVRVLSDFLSGAPDVQTVPCDDLLEGVKGVVAFHGKGNGEKSLWLRYRFAAPVLARTEYGTDSDHYVALKSLNECLTEPGWSKCDDPKSLLVGFIRHEPVGYPKGSAAVMFYIGLIKTLQDQDDDLRQVFDGWRAAH